MHDVKVRTNEGSFSYNHISTLKQDIAERIEGRETAGDSSNEKVRFLRLIEHAYRTIAESAPDVRQVTFTFPSGAIW